MPENGMEILSDVGKKAKKKKIPRFFLKLYIFISVQHEGYFHARISRAWWLQVCSGCRAAPAQTHSHAQALAGSFVHPSPSFPSSPTLSAGSINTPLLHEQFAWSAEKTIFPAGHFFPVSHSALNLTFWILWIFLRISLQNIIARLKLLWSIFQSLSGQALWLVCISAQNTFDNLCQYPVLVVLKFYNRVENC